MRCSFLISVFFLVSSVNVNAQAERTIDDILEQREIKKFNYTLPIIYEIHLFAFSIINILIENN